MHGTLCSLIKSEKKNLIRSPFYCRLHHHNNIGSERNAHMSNNNDSNTLPPQDRESGGVNNGGINTKKILQDLKADQEQFYSRISKIAQSEIAVSPPYNKQFEKILQNSAKRIAEIDRELKKLEEKQGDQEQA
jgi:hypothetical protein